ncbi:hypothetical protein OHT61_18110 [Streptomyces sp. NBC_00178]|uniref:hypothetical protein n=1 Tax=Streptomyces sp. NBC_00178 TaxID=2975672 RepID=UPI002E2997D4|nr:hypothetical protein [Streptomyces sp. NBC_00178]
MKTIARSAITMAAAAAIGVGVAASPASAASTGTVWGARGQSDNNPGNGAQSWVWAYTGDNDQARLTYQFYDNSKGDFYVWGKGQSASTNLSKDVWRIQVCVPSSVGEAVSWVCTGWAS